MGKEIKESVAEMIGTFALVFTGTGAVIINDISAGAVTHVGISLTFGLVVTAMIYAIGNISGAHINPAVTIAFCVGRKFPFKKAFYYIIFQLAGAFLASLVLRGLFLNHKTLGATLPVQSVWQSAGLEFLLTFLLMFVILCVTDNAKEKGIVAGAAIGATVGLGALFAGPISGASMNPVRSIAPAVISGYTEHLWIYIIAPICGAVFACFIAGFIQEH